MPLIIIYMARFYQSKNTSYARLITNFGNIVFGFFVILVEWFSLYFSLETGHFGPAGGQVYFDAKNAIYLSHQEAELIVPRGGLHVELHVQASTCRRAVI